MEIFLSRSPIYLCELQASGLFWNGESKMEVEMLAYLASFVILFWNGESKVEVQMLAVLICPNHILGILCHLMIMSLMLYMTNIKISYLISSLLISWGIESGS